MQLFEHAIQFNKLQIFIGVFKFRRVAIAAFVFFVAFLFPRLSPPRLPDLYCTCSVMNRETYRFDAEPALIVRDDVTLIFRCLTVKVL